ncbi:MAG: type II toxin-antitoxin system VapC family toxin [Nitrospirae bacterium]|nr:type II toxin-antitoxin system VapC family toxin [Nitrospirota bacterium]
MITAVDTNILLDILIPDESHFQKSKGLLDEYVQKGQLIVCEIVYAELASQFPAERELKDFLSDTGIRLVHSTLETLHKAGARWKNYSKNKMQVLQCPQCGAASGIICHKCDSPIKIRQHILGDFIIGAHALHLSELLLSRDRGFYGTYFKDLKIG